MSVAVEKAKLDTYDEDAVWIERHISGDSDAFGNLYAKYHDKVYAIARGILLHSEEAADTVQEIFTLVYRHLKRFDRRARFSTWLFRVAVNRSIQEARKHRNRWRLSELNEAIAKEAEPPEVETDPRVSEVLDRLSPTDRALLTLFYWEELSLNDIASTMECSANAAKTRLYRARERFRAMYEGHLD